MCNKEICRYPWVLEEDACSPTLLLVQKDNLKTICSAENDQYLLFDKYFEHASGPFRRGVRSHADAPTQI